MNLFYKQNFKQVQQFIFLKIFYIYAVTNSLKGNVISHHHYTRHNIFHHNKDLKYL